ncbi:MAG: ABC transporter permease [Lentisphaerae bacterium]|nr:ABC transporter permease [Lentisphaerota bacterium]
MRPARQPAGRFRFFPFRLRGGLGPVIGLVFVVLLFAVLGPAPFSSLYNAKTIVTQTVIVGIGALGMTFVIVSGGIDLSVGSLVALSTVVTAVALNALTGSGGAAGPAAPLLAALAGIAVCAACGFLSGLITARLRVVSFIVTLGMMQIARGLAKWLGREQTVMTPVNWLQKAMLVDPEPGWLLLAPGVWLMLGLLALVAVVLKYTVFGRHVFAIGSNAQTARLCGVNVPGRRIAVFALGGAFAGMAGVMQYANLTVGDPTAAAGMELDVIAAVVIGGGSLSGGEGSAAGSIVGALIMAVLRNGCNMLGAPNYVQEILIGAIIVCAVLIDRLRNPRTV